MLDNYITPNSETSQRDAFLYGVSSLLTDNCPWMQLHSGVISPLF